MDNLLNKSVEYKIQETKFGTWKMFLYSSGKQYMEFQTHLTLCGLPLFNFTLGVCPETGRRKTAKGIIGIGRFASGVVAIGQVSYGLIAIGQCGIGLFALGQLALGVAAVGQFAIAPFVAIGQFALGYFVVGQFAFGKMVLAQIGYGKYVWSLKIKDSQAIEFFSRYFTLFKSYIRG